MIIGGTARTRTKRRASNDHRQGPRRRTLRSERAAEKTLARNAAAQKNRKGAFLFLSVRGFGKTPPQRCCKQCRGQCHSVIPSAPNGRPVTAVEEYRGRAMSAKTETDAAPSSSKKRQSRHDRACGRVNRRVQCSRDWGFRGVCTGNSCSGRQRGWSRLGRGAASPGLDIRRRIADRFFFRTTRTLHGCSLLVQSGDIAKEGR